MRRIKTATLTFHYVENYGAVAQAYALHKKLINLGYDNDVINYRSSNLTNPISLKSLKHKGIVRYLLGNLYWIVRLLRRPRFNSFRSQMKITKQVAKHDLEKLKYDVFIVGSDQVWNHEITRMDDAYFLAFVKDKEKRKAYISRHRVNEDWTKINAGSLSRYLLWGEHTSLKENLEDYLERYKIKR